MTDRDDDHLSRDLARLPAPPIDAELSARVSRRARAAHRDRGLRLRPSESVVPALLLVAGAFYTVTSFQLMLQIFG
ncbi:MAG: hypothetical protein M3Y87_34030 [Myxococcota bacterium]|nr:hypothetical protein [Myxococcota bacterium]